MRFFLFRLDLSLHANAGKKIGILNFATKQGYVQAGLLQQLPSWRSHGFRSPFSTRTGILQEDRAIPNAKRPPFFCSVLGTMIMAVQWTGDASFGGREEHSETVALFRSNPVKKTSHRMFRHMYGVLNEIYLQIFFAWMDCKSRDESNEST